MKTIQISLIAAAFLLILSAGFILNQKGGGNFNLAGMPINNVQLAIFLITLGVIFYFLGRLMSFILTLIRKK